MKCECKRLCQIASKEPLVVHLMGCPESNETREYVEMPLYKKLFARDFRKDYPERYE